VRSVSCRRRLCESRALAAVVCALCLVAAAGAGGGAPAGRKAPVPCEPLVLSAGYPASVDAALRSKRDLWGERLLARPEGPTYGKLESLLTPLFLVGRPAGIRGTRLTDSGVYYLPLGEPGGHSFADAGSTEPFALHVADGSQVISRRANGRRATVYVGGAGAERYGSCLSRLATPELADGYLPVLRVRYTDADGVRYVEESLVARDPRTGALASYLRIEAVRGGSSGTSARIRVAVSDTDVTAAGGELRSGGRTVLAFGGEGRLDAGGALRFELDLADGQPDVVQLVRPIDPTRGHPRADAAAYAAARSRSIAAWKRRLAGGASIEVPQRLVADAMRNLLIQNLQLSWHYSLGNAYEGFYQAESGAAVLALAEYGFLADARTALETLLAKERGHSTNWEHGEKLAAGAAYYLLGGDAAFVRRHTPAYAAYARDFAARRAANPDGLLDRQRYSSDVTEPVYGLHHQARAWRGLRDMASVWGLVGSDRLADRYRTEARSFAKALRAAIARSATRVSSSETFVPVSLLADPPVEPWDPVTATRLGSYWNLVAPYAWSSGIVPRTSPLAGRLLEYALRRGSFLLGLVRFDYYPTGVGSVRCDGLPGLKTPGTDDVYGVERTRFLAELDRPDLLVLALYGQLAHGMTRGTFVSGEGATIGPVPPRTCPGEPDGEYYRSMYLPPSSTSNAFFLTTLRELLAHWSLDDDGRPSALHLAYSTPRAWLADGKRIAVRDLPTPFGRLAYSIDSHVADGYLDVRLTVPRRQPIHELRLRIRVPPGKKPYLARVGGGTLRPAGETFDLTGRTGTLTLRVLVRDA
jgi:hypothetical protein